MSDNHRQSTAQKSNHRKSVKKRTRIWWTERVQEVPELGGDAELLEFGQVGLRSMLLDETEEGSQISEKE